MVCNSEVNTFRNRGDAGQKSGTEKTIHEVKKVVLASGYTKGMEIKSCMQYAAYAISTFCKLTQQNICYCLMVV